MTSALLRPDEWNFPLLVHVAGAMVLVGALATVAASLLFAWRRDSAALTRLGFRTLLLAAIPAYVVMRVGAEWIASREDAPDDAAWIGVGYVTADVGALLLLLATILAGIAAWRLRRDTSVGRSVLGRIAAVITALLVVAYVVAVWAMTTKPS
jgi:hypothetical protein